MNDERNFPADLPAPADPPRPASDVSDAASPVGAISSEPASRNPDRIREGIVEALRTCYDPEIPVNIYELGLIYDVDVSAAGAVVIRMTLTSPACPAAQSLPPEVEAKALSVPGVTEARADVVWEPIWNPSMMTDAARLQLGFM
jgi:FeS assembly SUF system protein